MRASRPSRHPGSLLLRRAVLLAIGMAAALAQHESVAATPPVLPPPAPPRSNALPTPCASGACGKNGPGTFVSDPNLATWSVSGTTGTLKQNAPQVTLNWSNFDIGSNAKVVFQQPSSTAIALNRIFQANPSQIFGALTANGQVYLINQNGFVFGQGSRVNVAGLLASSLNVTDQDFNQGLLNTSILAAGRAALNSDGRTQILDNDGNPVLDANGNPQLVGIRVESGAELTTSGTNGRLLLASSNVQNAGTLSAPDGQVVLAAGSKVYLQASSSPNLRGLIVEVDGGGAVTNLSGGVATADRGDVSFVGLAVNQQGRVSATTSVTANGSVHLLAADTTSVIEDSPGNFQLTPQRWGAVSFESGSVTEVLPDLTSKTAYAEQAQTPSSITAQGQGIYFQGGSKVVMPGGSLNVTANENFVAGTPLNDARIHVDSGASIDLSGSSDTLPVTINVVEAQLRANELANSPAQRNGNLRGKTVYVDARVVDASGKSIGTTVGDVTGELALIPQDILQRTSAGGNVSFNSAGDVVVASGATINVSGGTVNYTPGYVATTKLVTASGGLVDIGSADPNAFYLGVVNPTVQQVSDRWGVITQVPTGQQGVYDPGYVQGSAAGKIQLQGTAMALSGQFIGSAVNGRFQRTPQTQVSGGQLIIGDAGGSSGTGDYRAPGIDLVTMPAPIGVGDDATLPAGTPLQLAAQPLLDNGFTSLAFYSNSHVTVAAGAPLTFAGGGSLTMAAPRVEIDANVTIPGGSITAQSQISASASAAEIASGGVFVADGRTLDVRGTWTNDYASRASGLATSPLLTNGGSIVLKQGVASGTVSLGNGDAFELSGGGWLNSTGKLSAGNAGSMTVSEGVDGTLALGNNIALDAYAVQGGKGGSLAITAPRIEIGSGGTSWAAAQTVASDAAKNETLMLDASLFNRYGFANVSLTADGTKLAGTSDTLTVNPGTVLAVQATSLLAASGSGLSTLASGSDLVGRLAVGLPATGALQTESLTLGAVAAAGNTPDTFGTLSVGKGAVITADPTSRVSLTGEAGVNFDGRLRVADGTVTLKIPTPGQQDPGYVASQQIDLGREAVLDVSGAVEYTSNKANLLQGTVLAGGTVDVFAQRGSVLAETGSVINFAGTEAPIDVTAAGATAAPKRTEIASAGGSLTVYSPEEISLLGTFSGAGGTGSAGKAAGGTLSVLLNRLADAGAPSLGTGFSTPPELAASFPGLPRTIELTPASPSVPQPHGAGFAVLGASAIQASGVDTLNLVSDQIEFTPATQLSLGLGATLRAPTILVTGGNAALTAPYLSLGAGSETYVPAVPVAGAATLTLSGTGSVDVYGSLVISGAQTTTIASNGPIAFRGNQTTAAQNGALADAGQLTLSASDVYVQSAVHYAVSATGELDLAAAGSAPGVPLSVGGSLSLSAPTIRQAGRLYAPFGTINFTADTLSLLPGSVTSVSGYGALLPFGRVENGDSWVWGLTTDTTAPVAPLGNGTIDLNAGKLSLESGAVVDARGGGDVYGYEWVPGSGGTKDALSASVNPTLYAVLPSLRGEVAPFDPLTYENNGLQAGQSVYLGAGGGLAAGVYTLLPARYALLPGAFLVSPVAGYANLAVGKTALTSDNATIVAGYLTTGTAPVAGAQTSGFVVRPGSYANELATYTPHDASTFFAAAAAKAGTAAPRGPEDGATVNITVSESMAAQSGVIEGAAASGGQAAVLTLATVAGSSGSAPALYIDGGTGASTAPAGAVDVAASAIDSYGAGRLVLGGTFENSGALGITTDTLTVARGASLVADEVLLVANRSVTLEGTSAGVAGASVASTSGATASATAPAAARFALPTALTLDGANAAGAAVLGVSDFADYVLGRGTAAASATGTVAVGQGASVASRGAINVDAPGGATLASSAGGVSSLSGVGAHWALGAGTLVFGTSAGASHELVVDTALANAIDQGSAARFTAVGPVDFNPAAGSGPVVIGSPSLASLTFNAASLENLVPGTAATVEAANVVLTGNGASPAVHTTADPLTGGTLKVTATSLAVGPGVLGIGGFDTTTLSANVVQGLGVGGVTVTGAVRLDPMDPAGVARRVTGDLVVDTATLTAGSGAATSLEAPLGALTLGTNGGPAVSRGSLASGGVLSLVAQTITDNASLVLPAGEVLLQATGATDAGGHLVSGTGAITLGSAATIDAAGFVPAQSAAAHGSAGGRVVLVAADAVSTAAGSVLDVSGASGAGAGSLDIRAGGSAALGGTLRGAAGGTGQAGGTFVLNAGSVSGGLNALAASLGGAGFTASEAVESHSGSLDLSAGAALTARHVTLVADNGAISVEGTIDASGTGKPGSIDLEAMNGVALGASAVLNASATDTTSRAGGITLSTQAGSLALDPASHVAAAGLGAGRLTLRAPDAGNDLALTSLPTDLSQVDGIVLEPLVPGLSALPNNPGTADFNAIKSEIATYVSAAQANLLGHFDSATQARVAVSPVAVLTSDGDLTLGSLNLASWRFAGDAATLVLRAAAAADGSSTGNVNLNGVISDGFVTVGSKNTANLDLLAGPSTSLVVVAGADTTSARLDATVGNAAADLTLADKAIVRTGTGALELAAARDLVFGNGASAFTAGTPGAPTTNITTGGSKPTEVYFATYPDAGGTVTLSAGRDVIAPAIQAPPSVWQPVRQVDGVANWGLVPGAYTWAVGALGGGDVNVVAGRDISNLSAAVTDSAVTAADGSLTYFGGGNLSVTSGRDVLSGFFYVGHGEGDIVARGALGSGRLGASGLPIGTMLLAGDATYHVQSQGDLLLETEVPVNALPYVPASSKTKQAYFNRFTAGDALDVASLGGGVTLEYDPANNVTPFLGNAAGQAGTGLGAPSLDVAAYGTDLTILNSVTLAPSDRGTLNLYASRDITSQAAVGGFVVVTNAPDSVVASALSPSLLSGLLDAYAQTPSDRRAGDTVTATVVAGRDISYDAVTVPKAALVTAGRDILNLSFTGEQPNDSDLTYIGAGRDLSFSTAAANLGISVGGGGRLEVVAGRNVDLGVSRGIVTTGRLSNSQLTTTSGAAVDVFAGVAGGFGVAAPGSAAAATDFLSEIVLGAEDPTRPAVVTAVSGTTASFGSTRPDVYLYRQALIDYVGAHGLVTEDAQAAANYFRTLPTYLQQPFLGQVLNAELIRAGREDTAAPVPASFINPDGTKVSDATAAIASATIAKQTSLTNYFEFVVNGSPVLEAALQSYVGKITGKTYTSYSAALADFNALPAALKTDAASTASVPSLQNQFRFSAGLSAINALFPGSDAYTPVIATSEQNINATYTAAGRSAPYTAVPVVGTSPYQGDITLSFSRIYSLDGGGLSLFAPGGLLNVGLATTPAFLAQQNITRQASDLGIVTEQAGNVYVFTNGDVLVNSSRIFTLGGGDIGIWSTTGSIDAGRGAKTAISAPPPTLSIAPDGSVSVNFAAAVAGSGIRTISTAADQPLGSVDLITPIGTVNAGDAGIGSAGNLNIAASSVAGLDNISVGGTSTGVPPQASGIAAALSAGSSAASSSSASAQNQAADRAASGKEAPTPLAQDALGWLDVFVTGLGEEGCRPDDVECLKRQKK